MNILAFLIVGLVFGYLAGKVIEGTGFGAFDDILVGMAGAIIGGFFFANSGMESGSYTGAIVTSTVGAVALLVLAGFLRAILMPVRAKI